MATVINNPPQTTTNDSGMGFFLAIVLIAILAIVFIIYGLPALRGSMGSPQVNVPGKVDVNVKNSGGGGKY